MRFLAAIGMTIMLANWGPAQSEAGKKRPGPEWLNQPIGFRELRQKGGSSLELLVNLYRRKTQVFCSVMNRTFWLPQQSGAFGDYVDQVTGGKPGRVTVAISKSKPIPRASLEVAVAAVLRQVDRLRYVEVSVDLRRRVEERLDDEEEETIQEGDLDPEMTKSKSRRPPTVRLRRGMDGHLIWATEGRLPTEFSEDKRQQLAEWMKKTVAEIRSFGAPDFRLAPDPHVTYKQLHRFLMSCMAAMSAPGHGLSIEFMWPQSKK
jgi:hypothetical protein